MTYFYLQSTMQKHRQWLDNRTYEQHILCLTKIRENFRKKTVKSALYNNRKRQGSLQQCDSPKWKQNGDSYPVTSSTSKFQKSSKISSKQKELIWDNFLLGKRIMDTSPVINNRKQQDEYKKHKKYIEWRIQRSKKMAVNTDFRQSKLKQYTLNSYRVANCHRLQTSLRSRFILCLKICSISLYKTSHLLQDVAIKMRTDGKKKVQSSQMINVANFPVHQFMFKYYSQKENKNMIAANDVFIDVFEVKGLEERHVGGFLIEKQIISYERMCQTTELRKVGKILGEVCYEVSICRRNVLRQQIQ